MCGIFNWIFFPIQMRQKTPSKNLNVHLHVVIWRKIRENQNSMMTEELDNFLSIYIYLGSTSHLFFFIYLIWQQDEINMINEWRFYTSFRETDIKMRRGKTNNKQNFNINKPLPNPWLIKTSPLWMGLILYVQVTLHL